MKTHVIHNPTSIWIFIIKKNTNKRNITCDIKL